MKISDIKGEQALGLLADILDPAVEIFADQKVAEVFRAGKPKEAIKIMLKGHPKAVIEILAATEGKPADEYEVNILTVPRKLLEIFNDPDLMSLFTSQGMNEAETSSTSASENTEAH